MTVILASGLFPTTERALRYLREADFIACCDGAANACVAAGFEPEEHADVMMVSDFGTFYPCCDTKRLSVNPGQEVSIWNFGASYFSAEGLMYPLYDFTKLWQGTLNVATRPDIAVHAKGTFLLYVAEPD